MKFLVFIILALAVSAISYQNILKPKSHGFPRMFGWIGLSWIFASCYPNWFLNPFSLPQLVSWALLVISLYFALKGLYDFKRLGRINQERTDQELFFFEKTTKLIDQGIYQFIRHPMYSSLIFLTWGISLKNPTPEILVLAILCTILFYFTARFDERECINYFGTDYQDYIKRSKMFIPYIF